MISGAAFSGARGPGGARKRAPSAPWELRGAPVLAFSIFTSLAFLEVAEVPGRGGASPRAPE